MSLELRKGSRTFFARIVVDGKRVLLPLEVKYEGEPPPGLRIRLQGDAVFERSRGVALEAERQLKERLSEPSDKVSTL
jgi:hypothetical protein